MMKQLYRLLMLVSMMALWPMVASAQAPSGAVVRVTLKLDGDQMLEVRSSGAFTLGVEIR